MSEWTDRLAAELQSLRSENAQLRAECGELREQIKGSAGLKCPDPECGDQGFAVVADRRGEPEQAQCEFCYTVPDSVFNRKQAALRPSTPAEQRETTDER